jgi:hypothetical protein
MANDHSTEDQISVDRFGGSESEKFTHISVTDTRPETVEQIPYGNYTQI